jgi:UDP-2,3-diacylglucosamine hydrolase
MIGLIAGWGRFPVVFAERARALGHRVCCIGLKGLAPNELGDVCAEYHSVSIAKFGRVWRTLQRAGVRDVVLAGKIHKAALLKPRLWLDMVPDWATVRFWYLRRRRDNRDDTLLLSVIEEMERWGLHCASALDYCPELLVKPGTLTKRTPTVAELDDVKFGWDLAKEMGRLDVGQSVAVRSKAVLAVEAIEGTDRAIARAGELARGARFVVVKVAKPQQDRRFDMPTIGISTIESMHAAGGEVLAVEAGQTIVVDEADVISLADHYGISIVSLKAA